LSKSGDPTKGFPRNDQAEQNQLTIGRELCELHPALLQDVEALCGCALSE
jgi:hypothetical protein